VHLEGMVCCYFGRFLSSKGFLVACCELPMVALIVIVLPLSLATQCCLLPCFLMSSIQCGLCEGKALLRIPTYDLCMRLSMSSMCTCCNTIIILLTIEIPSGPKPDDQPIEQLACMSNYMEAFYLYHFILCLKTAASKEACFQTSKMMGSSVSLLLTYSFKVCMGLVTPYMKQKMLATPSLLKEMKCSKKCHEEKTRTSSTK
jgi:hypothetical protein